MKLLYLIILLFAFQQLSADSLDVSGYKQIPNSIAATQYPRYDANDNLCETPKTIEATFGENNIELSKSGHIKHKSRFKVTEQKDKYDFTLSHGNNEGDQLDFKKYKKRKNLWLGGTIVSAGIGAYYLYSADSHYKEYQTATDNATDLHNQTKTEDTIWPIAFGVSGFCAVMTIINGSKQRKAKKQIGITVVPVEGGGMLSIKLNL